MRHPFSKSTITARYGATANRSSPHRGLDYAVKDGTWIPSVAPGDVVMNTWSDALGWVLVQTAWDVKAKKVVYVGYSHLKAKSPHKVGGRLAEGQGIGKQGNTGTASRGSHLHLTIGPSLRSIFEGQTVNPETFIDERI